MFDGDSMKDHVSPVHRDLVSHKIIQRDTGKTLPDNVAVFNYADGSQREFDGHRWVLSQVSFLNRNKE